VVLHLLGKPGYNPQYPLAKLKQNILLSQIVDALLCFLGQLCTSLKLLMQLPIIKTLEHVY